MKHIFTLSLLLLSITAFSQQKNEPAKASEPSQTNAVVMTKPSGASKNVGSPATPLPYDVNDKYMGRKDEFLSNLTVSELPADFPVYEKQWGVKEYNQVVTAFYYNHMTIVKESVRKKLELLQH